MGSGQASAPLTVMCPLCGADRGEPCTAPDQSVMSITGRRAVPTHSARIGEARRVAILTAPATEDVGRWATLEERAGR